MRTYGKGSVQEMIQMEGQSGELKLTVAYYYLPSGRLVHKKKDSTDWGVDPDFVVPMNTDQENRLMDEQYELDLIHGPTTHPAARSTMRLPTGPTSLPTTNPAAPLATAPTTGSSTEPVDPQLTAAVEVMLSDLRSKNVTIVPAVPQTQPATRPAMTSTNPPTI
jgi:hypothetical protein